MAITTLERPRPREQVRVSSCQEMLIAKSGYEYHGTHYAPSEMSISQRGEYAIGENGEVRARKYDQFIQLLIKRGDNISSVSFPLPLGVTPEMGQEILRQTLYSGDEHVPVHTFGVDKELRAMVRAGIPDNLVARFIKAAGDVIEKQHPHKRHRAVKKFFDDQRVRGHFAEQTQEAVNEDLANDDVLYKTAWRNENFGKRIFTMKHHYNPETGMIEGMGPAPEFKIFNIVDLAADDCHREWLEFYNELGALEGDWVLAHLDGGPTVDGGFRDGCAGSKRCSVFFDEMENPFSDKVFDPATGEAVDRLMDPILYEMLKKKKEKTCDSCGKEKHEDACKGVLQ